MLRFVSHINLFITESADVAFNSSLYLISFLVIYISFLVIHSCIQILIPTVFYILYPITFSFLITYSPDRYLDIITKYIYKLI